MEKQKIDLPINRLPLIAPSILSADIGNLAADIRSIEQAGADWLHVDVMDGSFVPPITWGANVVQAARKCSALFLDVHLMIINPDKHIRSFQEAGSNSLTVHQEACPDLKQTLISIRQAGMAAGVSVKPNTKVDVLFDFLEYCDLVLIMTVEPGWGGQKFIADCLPKIRSLKEEINKRGLNTKIEVDGGINAETAKLCCQAGTDILVAGSYLFGSKDRKKAIESLRTP